MNDSFTKVVSILVSEVSPGRFILGIAFDPLETELHNPNPTIYCSSSALFHGEESNSGGAAVNGKVHAVTGSNMDVVTDIITGLPISDHDHGVNGLQFGDNGELYVRCAIPIPFVHKALTLVQRSRSEATPTEGFLANCLRLKTRGRASFQQQHS